MYDLEDARFGDLRKVILEEQTDRGPLRTSSAMLRNLDFLPKSEGCQMTSKP